MLGREVVEFHKVTSSSEGVDVSSSGDAPSSLMGVGLAMLPTKGPTDIMGNMVSRIGCRF